jgi:hypothetical protein
VSARSTPALATLALTLALALLAAACVLRPDPPTITPQSVAVTSVTPQGLGVRIGALVHNPNRVALRVTGIDLRVLAADALVGVTALPQDLTLPARGDTPVAADVVVPWSNLPALGLVATLQPEVPYRVDGTANITAVRGMTFRVPFTLQGTIPQALLLNGALRALPSLPMLPGLPNLGLPGFAPAPPQ